MIEQLRESKVFKQHQELVFLPQCRKALDTVLYSIVNTFGKGEIKLKDSTRQVFLDSYKEGYLHSLNLTFETLEDAEKFLRSELRYRDQRGMVNDLQEKYQQNFLTTLDITDLFEEA